MQSEMITGIYLVLLHVLLPTMIPVLDMLTLKNGHSSPHLPVSALT